MNNLNRYRMLSFLVASMIPVLTQAALIGRDLNGDLNTIEAVYDDVLNISWLSDASLSATNNFGVSTVAANGRMESEVVNDWLSAMNASVYFGYSDWRSSRWVDSTGGCTPGPSPPGPCGSGWVMQDSAGNYNELGYMYKENFGALVADNGAWGIGSAADPENNLDLFSNIESNWSYWADYENTLDVVLNWEFSFYNGLLSHASGQNVIWAVRDGDSGVATLPGAVPFGGSTIVTPLPGGIWLFGSGLLSFVSFIRLKSSNLS